MRLQWKKSAVSLSFLGAAGAGCMPVEEDLPVAQRQGVLAQVAQRSLDLFARHAGVALRADPEAPLGLQVRDVGADDLLMFHTRLQQTHRGVPVFSGEAIVHLRSDGAPLGITDDTLRAVEVSPVPALAPQRAIDLAVAHSGAGRHLTAAPKADLWVLRIDDQGRLGEGRDRLVYRVSLRREDGTDKTSLPVIFIDAHTGEKVWEYDNLQTGTGTSLYSGAVTIGTYFRAADSTYYLEDIGRKVGTFNHNNTTSSLSRFTDANDVWGEAAQTIQRAGVDAHYAAEQVYDYYLNVHGRNGINGSGGPGSTTSVDGVTSLIGSRVHYGRNYNNAFWSGSYMVYGDGDGTSYSPLVTLDIAGHEMTHGVTQFTAGLIYSGESGAVNESISDVFGALVERAVKGEGAGTWLLGEDCYTPGNGTGDAIRHLDNPHNATNSGFTADDDPDHYSERYTGTADNGGVHVNSGIANKAFYLVAQGGTHHRTSNTLTGIGADAAGAIWYRALTSYMTSNTSFARARTATLNAADALYGAGSTQSGVVSCAWAMVGVGTDGCVGEPPPPGDELIVNGALEASLSPWVQSGTGAFYTSNGGYPHGGTGYIYHGAANNASGQTYQQLSIPAAATSANLTFWLNVTSNETTTSTQYDHLYVEVRSSAGALLSTLATFSNLNKGTAGAYTQRGPYSLLAYKGQTVRVQFRATTNSSRSTTFRIDDVSVR